MLIMTWDISPHLAKTLKIFVLVLLFTQLFAISVYPMFSSQSLISPVSAITELPPENPLPPPSNGSSDWLSFFTNTTSGTQVNFSVPPVTDVSNLFSQGFADPNQVVFTVTPITPPKYWRLEAYDYYNTTDWDISNTTKIEKTSFDSPGAGTVFTVSMDLFHTTVDSRYIPILSPPYLIDFNNPDALSTSFYYDTYDCLIVDTMFSEAGTTHITYTTTYDPLDIDYISSNALPPDNVPTNLRDQYTQIPSGLSLRVTNFASSFSSLSGSTYDRALYIMGYFRTHFVFDYNRFINGQSEEDANRETADKFLEYGNGTAYDFATTYALTLRLNGIPARIVFGFTPGEVEGSSRVIHVYNSHVWVEVLIPLPGGELVWVPFDPTPLPDFLLPDTDEDVQRTVYNINLALDKYPPVVNRSDILHLSATLLQNTAPLPDITVTFADETEGIILGTSVTNDSGVAEISFAFNNTSVAGKHIISAYTDFAYNSTSVYLRGNTTIDSVSYNSIAYWQNHLSVTGSLNDPTSNKGISNQVVTLYFDDVLIDVALTRTDGTFNFDYIVNPMHALGPHNVSLIFNSNYTVFDGYPPVLILNKSYFNFTVTVESIPQLSLSVTPNRVEHGNPVTLSGSLVLQNGTPLIDTRIDIYWKNSTYPDGVLIGSVLTDSAGQYTFDYVIPPNHHPEYVNIFASFITNADYPYIKSSNSTEAQLIVFIHVTLTINLNTNVVNHSDLIYIDGVVMNETYKPLPNLPVVLLFNGTNVKINGSQLQTTTNSSGGFSFAFYVPASYTGIFEVSVNVLSQLYESQSETDILAIWSFTRVIITDYSPKFVMTNENITITGVILDDANNTTPGLLNITVNNEVVGTFYSPTGTIAIQAQIPKSYTESTLNISFIFVEQYVYHESESQQITFYTFSNVTISLTVTPENVTVGGQVNISGVLTDNFNRPISNRFVLVYSNISSDPIGRLLTSDNGTFRLTYQLPENISNQDVSFYARLETANQNIHITSNHVNVYVYQPVTTQTNPLLGGIMLQQEMIYYLLIVLAGIFIVVVLYKRPDLIPIDSFKSLFKSKKKPMGKSIKYMIEELTQKIAQEKYRESILYMYSILLEALSAYKGERKPPNETPREFLLRVSRNHGFLEHDVLDFVEPYEKAKFSKREVTQEDHIRMLQGFARLFRQVTGVELKLAY